MLAQESMNLALVSYFLPLTLIKDFSEAPALSNSEVSYLINL